MVKTDHILFICSGAFHLSKPSDLLPELQGRLPTRVELRALTREDFIRILTEPEANLIKQYKALMATEDFEIEFTEDAIEKIADIAVEINQNVENIGARRLQTVMELLLEDIAFNASDRPGQNRITSYNVCYTKLLRGQENGVYSRDVYVYGNRLETFEENGEKRQVNSYVFSNELKGKKLVAVQGFSAELAMNNIDEKTFTAQANDTSSVDT